jgi:ketosteroid isomerase-like protein
MVTEMNISAGHMEQTLRRFAEALAHGAADTAEECFTEEAIYEEPPRFRFEGRQALRAFLRDFAERHDSARFTVLRTVAEPERHLLAAEWEWRYVSASDGKEHAFAGMSFITFEGERIAAWRGFSAVVTL